MIKSIALKGFQSHEDTTIEFDEGLNVLTGATDSGKTAIIRAIRWVIFNEPSGDAFVNKAVGSCEVTIINTRGDSVTKTRNKSKTTYEVTKGGQTSVYEKTEPPQELRDMFGIEESHFGDFTATLNFAYQLAAPFLLSEPPSAGAKVLGKLAGSEVVDLAIKAAAKEVYSFRQEQSQAKKEQESLSGQLKEYEGLERIKGSLDACDYVMELVGLKVKREADLENILASFQTAKASIGAAEAQLARFNDLVEIEEDLQGIKKAQQRYGTLLSLHTRFSAFSQKLSGLTNTLKNYEHLTTASTGLKILQESSTRYVYVQNLKQVYQKNSDLANSATSVLKKVVHIVTVQRILQIMNGVQDKLKAHKIVQVSYVKADRGRREAVQALNVIGDTTTVVKAIDSLQENVARFYGLQALQNTRYETIFEENAKRCVLETAVTTLANAERGLKDLWSSLEVCPLCNQKLWEENNGKRFL